VLVVGPDINVLCPPRTHRRDPAAADAAKEVPVPVSVRSRYDDLVAALSDVVASVRVSGTGSPIAPPLYLDADRTAVLEDLASVVHCFDSGAASGNVFGRMITGPAGVGKSSFLQAMVLGITACAKRTLAAYFNVNALTPLPLPSELVARVCAAAGDPAFQLPEGTDTRDHIAMISALCALRVHVVLVLDELHTAFTRSPAEGHPWFRQIASLIVSSSAAVSVVMSGSSDHLADLCFGKYPKDAATEAAYPSYYHRVPKIKRDCTSQLHLGPIRTVPDLRGYLLSRCPAAVVSWDVGAAEALLRASGGYYKALDECLGGVTGSSLAESLGHAAVSSPP